MDDQLVGVVLGGLIAIIGGAVGPWMQHRLAVKDRKEEAKRQSVLEVIQAIFSHNEYSEKLRQSIAFGKDIEVPPNPLARIEGLIAVDFPHCYAELATFRYAASSIFAWSTEFAVARVNGKPLSSDGWAEVIRHYSLASGNLIAAVSGRSQMTIEQVWGDTLKATKDAGSKEGTDANFALATPPNPAQP